MPPVTTQIEGKIGWLVLNRPEKLNALSSDLLDAFEVALDQLASDPEVVVIAIRGEGRAFSAGYDISHEASENGGPGDAGNGSSRESAGYADRRRTIDDWRRLRHNIDRWLKVWRCPKPVLAVIHGHCMGGATMLAVCCDMTIVAEDTVIGWPQLPLGGGLAGPISLWLVGPKKAKELSYIVGSTMTGTEAAQLGWANYAVPADELMERATRLARQVAKTPPELLEVKKLALNRIMDMQGFSEMVMFGAEFDAIAHDSDSYDNTIREIRENGIKVAIQRFHAEGE
jgi:enoyl-CoA hydratase